MGNTPSQTGFHIPPDSAVNPSSSTATINTVYGQGHPHPQHLSNLSQSASNTSLKNMRRNEGISSTTNDILLHSGTSVPNAVVVSRFNGKSQEHSKPAEAFTSLRTNHSTSSKPIQFVEKPVLRSVSWEQHDQPQSMDSLALDTSNSIYTGDISPSSLSPQEKQFQYQNPSLGVVHMGYEIKDEQDVLSHFDSLDESIDLNGHGHDDNESIQDSLLNPTASSPSIVMDSILEVSKDKDNENVVTVNGFQVAPNQIIAQNTCSSESSVDHNHKRDNVLFRLNMSDEKNSLSGKSSENGDHSVLSSGFVSEADNSIQNKSFHQNNIKEIESKSTKEDVHYAKNISKLPMHVRNMDSSDLCSALNTNNHIIQQDLQLKLDDSLNTPQVTHAVTTNTQEINTNNNLKLPPLIQENVENSISIEGFSEETASDYITIKGRKQKNEETIFNEQQQNSYNKNSMQCEPCNENLVRASTENESTKIHYSVADDISEWDTSTTKYGEIDTLKNKPNKCIVTEAEGFSNGAKNNSPVKNSKEVYISPEKLQINTNVSLSKDKTTNEMVVVTKLILVDGAADSEKSSKTHTPLSLVQVKEEKDIIALIPSHNLCDETVNEHNRNISLEGENGNPTDVSQRLDNEYSTNNTEIINDPQDFIHKDVTNKTLQTSNLENELIPNSLNLEKNNGISRKGIIESESLDEFEALEAGSAEVVSSQLGDELTTQLNKENITEVTVMDNPKSLLLIPSNTKIDNIESSEFNNAIHNFNDLENVSQKSMQSVQSRNLVNENGYAFPNSHNNNMKISSDNSIQCHQDQGDISDESLHFHKEATKLVEEIVAEKTVTATKCIGVEANNLHGIHNGTRILKLPIIDDASQTTQNADSHDNIIIHSQNIDNNGIPKNDSTTIELRGQHISKVYVSNEETKIKPLILPGLSNTTYSPNSISADGIQEHSVPVLSKKPRETLTTSEESKSFDFDPNYNYKSSPLMQEENFFNNLTANQNYKPTKLTAHRKIKVGKKSGCSVQNNTGESKREQPAPSMTDINLNKSATIMLSPDLFDGYDSEFSESSKMFNNSENWNLSGENSKNNTSCKNNTFDNLPAMMEALELSHSRKRSNRTALSQLPNNNVVNKSSNHNNNNDANNAKPDFTNWRQTDMESTLLLVSNGVPDERNQDLEVTLPLDEFCRSSTSNDERLEEELRIGRRHLNSTNNYETDDHCHADFRMNSTSIPNMDSTFTAEDTYGNELSTILEESQNSSAYRTKKSDHENGKIFENDSHNISLINSTSFPHGIKSIQQSTLYESALTPAPWKSFDHKINPSKKEVIAPMRPVHMDSGEIMDVDMSERVAGPAGEHFENGASISLRRVIGEYEKTLATYIEKVDDMKSKLSQVEDEKLALITERDLALEDLRNVESAFTDVHRKYERSKSVLQNLKANEETLIHRDHELVHKIEVRDKKIDAIKEKAQEGLEQMHLDYENRIRDLESENTRLRAQFRKMEMRLESLENDVEQKAKENAQLSALCDELINGQGVN